MELSDREKKMLGVIIGLVIVIIGGIFLIALIKNYFSCIGCNSFREEYIQNQISQQIIDDLRTGNNKLFFTAHNLNKNPSAESIQYVGIKNTGDFPVDVIISFQVKADSTFSSFTSEQALFFKNGALDVKTKIIWDDSSQKLKPGESRVLPVTITAPDKPGNYLYKIIVTNVATGEEYDTRTFFIKTVDE